MLPAVTADHLRDVVMTGAVFAFTTTVWLGWALEHPPRPWRRWLFAGLGVGYALLAGAIVMAVAHWNDGTVFDDPTTTRQFAIAVGIEFLACGVGAAVLGLRRRSELIPVWIAFVVGVHFFPLAAILGYPWIDVVAVLTTGWAVAALPISRRRSLPVSAVNGAGMGVALLIGALVALGTALAW